MPQYPKPLLNSSAHCPSISTVFLATLGCARNQIDSEVMLGRLKNAGIAITKDPQEAEAIVVNTCCFIEPAADESIDTILELAAFKKDGRCQRLIVAGCLPQRYGEAVADALPEVDLFLGTGAFDRIVNAIRTINLPENCILPDPDAIASTEDGSPRPSPAGPMAYLKIAEGCNRQCTYCIIPKLRGRQKSRAFDRIMAEARQLAASGIRELVLVAQESTAYGTDLAPSRNLTQLLEALSQLQTPAAGAPDGVGQSEAIWVRFLYGHPQSIDEGLIKTIARHDNLCSYFDVPIQHVSSRILKRMGRRYSKSDVMRLFDTIRHIIPEAALRTTVITGFPGETDRDFDELLEFIQTVGFDHLGCFAYSDAEDLAAHRLTGHVPDDIARNRHDRVMEVQKEISTRRIRRYRDAVVPVLIEDELEPRVYAGRTQWQAPEVDGITIVHAAESLPGCFANVKITDTLEYDLVGDVP